ncbi:nucleoside deaminase [Tunicatimonas pelagia]|uniref:nucleoside deaminase n=1 Tax=Tunicatimonas pelagia TaxID=931531 RepID=UPI002664FDFD|nr:nucleoside deaminase [Tunicatimonas pelagia]WKN45772.1 nucleoside deaminase [Tunicatimonas pelagia]
MDQTTSGKSDNHFISIAINLAREGMRKNAGGPFGAIVVKNQEIVGYGHNQVTSSHDPTAHAEVVAIRDTCQKLGTFELNGCIIYTSCEPCPMCLGAIYWARIDQVVFAATRHDAAQANFDDEWLYQEIPLVWEERKLDYQQIGQSEAVKLFEEWNAKLDKVRY